MEIEGAIIGGQAISVKVSIESIINMVKTVIDGRVYVASRVKSQIAKKWGYFLSNWIDQITEVQDKFSYDVLVSIGYGLS